MITGYNTDVRYGEIVLHVQTEDKGKGNPCIESLIYYGGQVVAAKQTDYAELLKSAGETTGDEITALMEQQHRAMMKAIQAGKFDDKIRLFVPDKKLRGGAKTEVMPLDTATGLDLSEEGGRSLDQVILEYLTSEAEQEQLLLLLDEEIELQAGARADLVLRTRSSKSGDPVVGAKVNVKMISTFGGPRTLGLGETDGDGFLQLGVDIPSVDRGTAAVIITAASDIGQAELKHLL